MTYREWVRLEAKAINTDGCTLVSEIYQWCCFEHDLVCRRRKNPRDAYRKFRKGVADYWSEAKDMSRSDGDTQFRKCIQKNSPLGKFSPISWIRYAGVSVGTGWEWFRSKF